MLSEQLEELAKRGEAMPKKLDPPEIMLYQSLAALYQRYRVGGISVERARFEKRSIYSAYRQMLADYDLLHDICREYQRRLREGYSVGGRTVMHGGYNNE